MLNASMKTLVVLMFGSTLFACASGQDDDASIPQPSGATPLIDRVEADQRSVRLARVVLSNQTGVDIDDPNLQVLIDNYCSLAVSATDKDDFVRILAQQIDRTAEQVSKEPTDEERQRVFDDAKLALGAGCRTESERLGILSLLPLEE